MIFCDISASNVTLSWTKAVNFILELLVRPLTPINTYFMRFSDDFEFCPTTVPSL